eukprot:244972_1
MASNTLNERHFFAKLKQFHGDVKNSDLTVYGYIRNVQETLFADEHIPDVIFTICLIYYHASDQWDPEYISPQHTLIENTVKHSHTNIGGSCLFSCFGNSIVSKGQYHWKFIYKRKPSSTAWCINIGIWKVKTRKKPPTETYFTENGRDSYATGYAYLLNCGHMVSASGGATGQKYGVTCNEGDTIDMFVDFDTLTLKYNVNDKDMGIAHLIENTPYRVALMTCVSNFEIEML